MATKKIIYRTTSRTEVKYNHARDLFAIVVGDREADFLTQVAELKGMPGAVYDIEKKRWYLPATSWRFVLIFARKWKSHAWAEACAKIKELQTESLAF